jgi:DNA-binding GntR family transcriptional regulator
VAVRDIRVWLAPALDLLDSSPVRRQKSLDSHGALIAALRARDRAAAGAAMRAHLAVTASAVAAALAATGVAAEALPR